MRAHVEGALSRGSPRVWVGRDVPPFVLVQGGTRELFLLDQAPDGFVGLYRDPYGASSCRLDGDANCSFGAALFECSGKTRWLFALDPFLSRKDHLEIQDMRYADGVLYFNEACQSYSREAQGKCSSLVAVEPLTKTLLWRTRPLVSNATFLVAGRYLITGYGFTAEPDALFLVRRSDGKIMSSTPIPRRTPPSISRPTASSRSALTTGILPCAFAPRASTGSGPASSRCPGSSARPRMS